MAGSGNAAPATWIAVVSPRFRIRWSQLRIGLVVSLVALAASITIFFIDEVKDAIVNRYTLYFDTFTTQSLGPRAPVWLAGQPVGHVRKLEFHPPARGTRERLLMELSIRTEARPLILEGSEAQVITAGLLGEAVVNIIPAAEPGPPIPEGGRLPTAPQIDPAEVAQRMTEVNDSFAPVIDRWQQVLDIAVEGDGTLARLFARPAEFSTLNRRLADLRITFDTLGHAARGVAELMADERVRAALHRLGPRMSRVATLLREREGTLAAFAADTAIDARLENISRNIDRIARRVESGRGTLGRLLYDDALFRELSQTRALLRAFREEIAPAGPESRR